jgi:hypothetical protein
MLLLVYVVECRIYRASFALFLPFLVSAPIGRPFILNKLKKLKKASGSATARFFRP